MNRRLNIRRISMGADRKNGGKVGFNREFPCELMPPVPVLHVTPGPDVGILHYRPTYGIPYSIWIAAREFGGPNDPRTISEGGAYFKLDGSLRLGKDRAAGSTCEKHSILYYIERYDPYVSSRRDPANFQPGSLYYRRRTL